MVVLASWRRTSASQRDSCYSVRTGNRQDHWPQGRAGQQRGRARPAGRPGRSRAASVVRPKFVALVEDPCSARARRLASTAGHLSEPFMRQTKRLDIPIDTDSRFAILCSGIKRTA